MRKELRRLRSSLGIFVLMSEAKVMNRKVMSIAFGALLLGGCTLEELFNTSRTDVTLNEKVVSGLRQALEVGIDSSSRIASRLNGYLAHKVIKILLPAEAEEALKAAEAVAAQVKPFASELQLMQDLVDITPGLDRNSFASNVRASSNLLSEIAGLESIGDSVVKYMNRAAEYSAPRSVPIFKGAITGMSLSDGLALLNGSDSMAATAYLEGKTFNPLVKAYAPIVDSTLALVPLTRYWGDFRSAYNSILSGYNRLLAFQEGWNGNSVVANVPDLQVNRLKKSTYKPIETESLGAWTTDKALSGLFYLVGEEEKEIRRDPLGYVKNLASEIGEILWEVFGEIMEMEK